MEGLLNYYISDEEKYALIDKLTPELSLLRAKAEISQEEIANIIGTSRQTYGSIERKARRMSWNTYLSLVWFFDCNRKTHNMIRGMDAFPHELVKKFNDGDEPSDFEIGLLFKSDTKSILETLDEQAISTIKTILMVEYSRCNKISGEAVVKFFEGFDISRKEPDKKDSNTFQAIKTLRGHNK